MYRRLANIYIPEVPTNLDSDEFEAVWQAHVAQKQLFRELSRTDADSEDVLEALETFVGTANMDDYISSIEPQLSSFINTHGLI